MIRGLDTLRADFNVLQALRRNLSSNVANVNTSGYQQKHLFQAALADVRLHNYENGPKMTNTMAWLGELAGTTRLVVPKLIPRWGRCSTLSARLILQLTGTATS